MEIDSSNEISSFHDKVMKAWESGLKPEYKNAIIFAKQVVEEKHIQEQASRKLEDDELAKV